MLTFLPLEEIDALETAMQVGGLSCSSSRAQLFLATRPGSCGRSDSSSTTCNLIATKKVPASSV